MHVQQNKQSSGCAGEEAGKPLMQPQQSEQNHSRHARYAVQGCSSACGTLFSVLGPPRSLAAVEALYSAHNMAQGEQHARSLIHACIHSSTHLFVRLFVVHSCMHSFFLSFFLSFFCSCIRSLLRLSLRSSAACAGTLQKPKLVLQVNS